MLDTEFALKGVPIRVNAIAPGVYASEMTFENITPELTDEVGKGHFTCSCEEVRDVSAALFHYACLLNELSSGQEMAGTAVYLASRAGGYTRGQEIIIDGGFVSVNPSTV